MKKFLTLITLTVVSPATLACGCNWVIKAGAGNVDPQSYSEPSSATPTVGQVTADDGTALAFSGTYMMNDYLGVEILAATPFSHDIVVANGVLAGAAVGSIKHLPPTVTLNWFPFGSMKGISPYLGTGINYTNTFDEKTAADVQGLGYDKLSLDNSWGIAAVVGVDFNVSDKWLINASAMAADIGVTAALRDSTGTAGTITVDYDLNPWVYRLGVGYRF